MSKDFTRAYWEGVLADLKPEGRHFIGGEYRAAASGADRSGMVGARTETNQTAAENRQQPPVSGG